MFLTFAAKPVRIECSFFNTPDEYLKNIRKSIVDLHDDITRTVKCSRKQPKKKNKKPNNSVLMRREQARLQRPIQGKARLKCVLRY